jgi:hypothetical protein
MASRPWFYGVIGAAILGYAAFGALPVAAEEAKPTREEPALSTENARPVICKWVQGANGWVCFELKKPH